MRHNLVSPPDERGIAPLIDTSVVVNMVGLTYSSTTCIVATDVAYGTRQGREVGVAAAKLATAPQIVIVDGYVWLDASGRAGLGATLHQALGGQVAVVGVAKRAFAGSDALAVRRGGSERPLFVTSIGLNRADAAQAVREMPGRHRLPDMLRRADGLGRERLAGGAVRSGPRQQRVPQRRHPAPDSNRRSSRTNT